MRLLNVRTRKLVEFFDGRVPPYAILSHTWGDDEITLQDLQDADAEVASRFAYRKIEYTCIQAGKEDLTYAWIDTCCIDKTSSAELSEAINSMYRWYLNSEVCYVYLSDVPGTQMPIKDIPPNFGADDWEEFAFQYSSFTKSRWFTRGWTLQELISPGLLSFYGRNWNFLGRKNHLKSTISRITGIDRSLLSSSPSPESLRTISVAKKFYWASTRQTSRVEDQAYCLLGLFGVNLPLLYGEGQNAFIRLQEEIIRTSDDETVFAWEYERTKDAVKVNPQNLLLASSPACFYEGDRILRLPRKSHQEPYSLTNKGLRIRLPVALGPKQMAGNSAEAILACHYENDFSGPIALRVMNEDVGGNEWSIKSGYTHKTRKRLSVVPLMKAEETQEFTILIRREQPMPKFSRTVSLAFSASQDTTFFIDISEALGSKFALGEGFPSQHWNREGSTMTIPKGQDGRCIVGLVNRVSFADALDFDDFDVVLGFGSDSSNWGNAWVLLRERTRRNWGSDEFPLWIPRSLQHIYFDLTAYVRHDESNLTFTRRGKQEPLRATIRRETRMDKEIYVIEVTAGSSTRLPMEQVEIPREQQKVSDAMEVTLGRAFLDGIHKLEKAQSNFTFGQ